MQLCLCCLLKYGFNSLGDKEKSNLISVGKETMEPLEPGSKTKLIGLKNLAKSVDQKPADQIYIDKYYENHKIMGKLKVI